MYARELIERLHSDGITLRVDNGDLIPDYKSRKTLNKYLPEIRRHKQDLIAELSAVPVQAEKSAAATATCIEDCYKQEIREVWSYCLDRLARSFMKNDGLTEPEAKATAKDILTYTAEQHIQGGLRYGLRSIKNPLLEEVHFYTSDIQNERHGNE